MIFLIFHDSTIREARSRSLIRLALLDRCFPLQHLDRALPFLVVLHSNDQY